MGASGFDQFGNKALQEHWIRRLVAIIIDNIIVWIPVFVLSFVPFFWYFGLLAWGWLSGGVILFLYSILLEIMMGATIGKKVMNLKVVGIQEQLTPMMVVIRNVTKIVPILLLIDWIVGMLTPGDPRQKYTDRMVGCTVSRTDDKAYQEEQFRVAQYQRPPPAHGYQPYQQPQQPYQQPTQQPQQPAEPSQAPPAQQPPEQQPPGTWGAPEPTGPKPKFCVGCGGPLNERPDGRMQCPACGRLY